MNAFPPMQTERIFVPFLDEVDGTLCLPADATAANLESLRRPHPLRFPLFLDPEASLRQQIEASTHAPASCRFGPYCDNILGMNWRLPSGRVARIGERVVKTTTGYDWLRFLLHSGTRFGEPIDYVIRLRPDCGFTLTARFEGESKALADCVPKLLQSGWMHWWDSVDMIVEGSGRHLRVMVHCIPAEAPIFASQLRSIASGGSGVALTLHENALPPCDGLPDLVCKTTPDRVLRLANDLAGKVERVVALCYSGVVHLHLKPGPDLPGRIHELALSVAGELHPLGGEWHSRWLPSTPPPLTESSWIETLEQAVHGS
jgi:hypothetical protein